MDIFYIKNINILIQCISEHLEITKPEHIQCYDNNITYSPTNKPVLSTNIDIYAEYFNLVNKTYPTRNTLTGICDSYEFHAVSN